MHVFLYAFKRIHDPDEKPGLEQGFKKKYFWDFKIFRYIIQGSMSISIQYQTLHNKTDNTNTKRR